MERYKAYKDSGIDWIGEIPATWKTSRLKVVLQDRKEKNDPVKTEEILSLTNTRGVIPYSEKGDIGNRAKEDLTGYMLAYPGDIVVNSMNIIIGSVGLSHYFGAVSPVYYMLRPRDHAYSVEYYNYIFQMKEFQDSLKGYGNGILEIRMRIPMSNLNTVPLPVPPPIEQKTIAAYLDIRSSEIDELIANQERCIELLKEYRKAVISEAVTKGLDPDVPMKDSGIDWIGEIPWTWNVDPLKQHFRYEKDSKAGLYTAEYIGEHPGKYPIYSGQTENEGITGNVNFYDYEVEECIFVTTVGAKAMTANVLQGRFSLSQNCLIMLPRDRSIVSYYYYFLQPLFEYQKRCISLIMQPSLRMSDLNMFKIVAPPSKEQEEIALFLNKETSEIDSLVADKLQLIEKLKEYRKSLISEAVTGKFKVPGVA